MPNQFQIPSPSDNTLKVVAELDVFGALHLLKLGALRAAHGTPLMALQQLFASRSTEIGRAFELERRKQAAEWLGSAIQDQPLLTHREKAAIYTAAIAILHQPTEAGPVANSGPKG